MFLKSKEKQTMSQTNCRSELDFCKKLAACIKEYKKQQYETNDDIDAAHFYDKKLKQWIIDHMAEIDILATLNLNKSFVTFVKHYLIKEDE